MNAAERRTAILSLVLLLLGWGARALPPSLCENCGDLAAVQAVEVAEKNSFPEASPGPAAKANLPLKRTASKSKTVTGPIRINHASLGELQKVKGIGPVMAKRIVDFREKNGPYRGAKDLDKVQGIGQKKLDNLLPFLIFD